MENVGALFVCSVEQLRPSMRLGTWHKHYRNQPQLLSHLHIASAYVCNQKCIRHSAFFHSMMTLKGKKAVTFAGFLHIILSTHLWHACLQARAK
jgi:hypothetical protein